MRLSGSFAVLADVNFAFMPVILAQKEFFRDPPSGWGGFKFIPSFFADARPLAFKPPFGFFPSLRCHAGLLAILGHRFLTDHVYLQSHTATVCASHSNRQNIRHIAFDVSQNREEV